MIAAAQEGRNKRREREREVALVGSWRERESREKAPDTAEVIERVGEISDVPATTVL